MDISSGADKVRPSMSGKNLLPAALVAILFLCVLGTAGLCYTYVRSVKTLQSMQYEAAIVNRRRALLNALAADLVEYGRRNPAIDPILLAAGLKTSGSTNSANLPGAHKK